MKSNPSSSAKIDWNSPLEVLFRSKTTKTCEKLEQIGVQKLEDLLWILPLRVQKLPNLDTFESICEGELFTGQGEVLSFQNRPNFRVRGKRGIPLQNITLVVKDHFSHKTINLKWFNTYPSLKDKLAKAKAIYFTGTAQIYQESWQIISPDYHLIEPEDFSPLPTSQSGPTELRIQYPTINSISSSQLNKLFSKISKDLWINIPEVIPQELQEKHNLLSRAQAFQIMHGRCVNREWKKEDIQFAKERLVYEELYLEQLKIRTRRQSEVKKKAPRITIDEAKWTSFQNIYPYKLTADQQSAINDIRNDFESARPMMRLIQGDVGCGKTSVALTSALAAIEAGLQVAFMCPTESLAGQHFSNCEPLLKSLNIDSSLLIGSQSPKQKQMIQADIASGKTQLIFGTHSLIQKNVSFSNLGLAIIDEQHKFGVNQRMQLIQKGEGTHCLIMTATPIPRSLSLTQYGDLDITTIKELPSGRKGIKTRIVGTENFEKFLSFVKTRLSMDEQVYVVVPAITENPTQDILNLEQTEKNFKKYFPEFKISGLHGQMKPEEKIKTFEDFQRGEIQLIVSTSVIEVGINVVKASIMAVMNPERFGLSSLHQLRGRVGRGDRPGFCFLVLDKPVAQESMQRLSVIENNIDGFIIAEEDLKIRGEGNLFGIEQSGAINHRKVSDIIKHQDILLAVRKDIEMFKDHPFLLNKMDELIQDERIFSTV